MDGMTYATQEEADAAAKKDFEAKEEQRNRDLVDVARKRFAMCQAAETEMRREAEEDIRFRAGKQWSEQDLRDRQLDKRPALVINKLPQVEHQITNEARQSKNGVQVSPVDSGADVETAEVLQGMVRHIESDSSADVAYITALISAVRGGWGFFRLVTEYESESSFDQCLKIKRVLDPFSVYLDPNCQEPDGSDAEFGFVVGEVSEDEYEATYGEAAKAKATGGWGIRTSLKEKTCQVVEYFRRERVKDTLLRLARPGPDGQTETIDILRSNVEAMLAEAQRAAQAGDIDALIRAQALAEAPVVAQRPTVQLKVFWTKIAGSTVVDEREFPSKWIPIFPVLGDELIVDGKRVLEGLIRHARDPQRMYNFWTTAITETIAQAPKAPWIGAEGQFDDHAEKWGAASRRNFPFLEYKPKTLAGQLIGPPQRNAYEPPIAAMSQATAMAADDLKSTTAIYDASLGARSNETSGVAIEGRKQQGQTGNFHFPDNLSRAQKHLGRVLVDAIPRVYSGARVVRIIGEDLSEQLVGINGAPMQQGQKRPFDVARLLDAGTGRYDVNIRSGPPYSTKRQQAVGVLLELTRSSPQVAQYAVDLMVRNMDFPGADALADRLEKLLPEHLRPQDQSKKVDPQALAQQLAQASEMVEKLSQELNKANDELDSKRMELESKEQIALLDSQTKLTVARLSAEQDDRADAIADLERLLLAVQQRRLARQAPASQQPAP